MQIAFRSLALFAFTGLGMLTGVGTTQAHSYRHIDRLALQLQRQTRSLHREVHAHFRRTPQYRHLDRDVTIMERLARHIHQVAHRRGSIRHLRHDVEELDRLYHHIQGLVRIMARSRRIDCRALIHFRGELRRIGSTLHHLRADLRHLDSHRDHRDRRDRRDHRDHRGRGPRGPRHGHGHGHRHR